MIDPASLDFPPLNCSREAILGPYYQDLSEAITLVESGYHGRMDNRGIPLVAVPGQGNFPNAVTTAQYALANMIAVRRGDERREARARAQLDWLVENQEQSGELTGCWLVRYDNQKYTWLRAPWTGSLASGHALSALLRGHEMFADDRYRVAADAAYIALLTERGAWTLYRNEDGDLWYEEYPASEQPLHVLNGHIYTSLAVLDYARVTGDSNALHHWECSVATARRHLEEFDSGYWSVYDLRFRELVSIHYHKNVHLPQLRIVAALTSDPSWREVADRWERYLNSRLCRMRLAVSLRVRARLKR